MKTVAYLRVSKDTQDVKNQKLAILFASLSGITKNRKPQKQNLLKKKRFQ